MFKTFPWFFLLTTLFAYNLAAATDQKPTSWKDFIKFNIDGKTVSLNDELGKKYTSFMTVKVILRTKQKMAQLFRS